MEEISAWVWIGFFAAVTALTVAIICVPPLATGAVCGWKMRSLSVLTRLLPVIAILGILAFAPSPTTSAALAEPQSSAAPQSDAAPTESQAKPGKVTSVQTRIRHGRKIMVNWQPPTSGGDPDRYLVQAKRKGQKPIRHIINADSSHPYTQFTCLDLGKTYKLRVRGINDAGRGPVTVRSVHIPNDAYIVPTDSHPCPDGKP